MLALLFVLIAVPGGLYLFAQLDTDAEDAGARADGGDDATSEQSAPEADSEDDDTTEDGPGEEGPADGDSSDTDEGSEGDPDPNADADPDTDPGDRDIEVAPLDPDPLTGLDLLWGELLIDIDASERAMIAFQDDLADAFASPGLPEDALDAASEVAADRRDELLGVRARLASSVDDAGAEEVRSRYVIHLDSWASFMAAVEEDPLVVLEQSERGFTVDINATADAFARALEAELPPDVDAEVERFAEAILDRGFPGFGTAQV